MSEVPVSEENGEEEERLVFVVRMEFRNRTREALAIHLDIGFDLASSSRFALYPLKHIPISRAT